MYNYEENCDDGSFEQEKSDLILVFEQNNDFVAKQVYSNGKGCDPSTQNDENSDIKIDEDSTSASGLFSSTANTFKSQDIGPNIDQELAETVNGAFRKGIEDAKFKEIEKNYLPPGNCPALKYLKVNDSVWPSSVVQAKDLGLQIGITTGACGSTALLQGQVTAIKLMTNNCFMASIDLKDEY